MSKFLPTMAILAMGLLGSGCCQFTGSDKPIHIKSTGGVVVVPPVPGSSPVGFGKLQAVYVPPADYKNHPVDWSTGAAASKVGGPAKTMLVGPYIVQFIARKPGDVPPPAKVVTVTAGKLVVLKVSFSP